MHSKTTTNKVTVPMGPHNLNRDCHTKTLPHNNFDTAQFCCRNDTHPQLDLQLSCVTQPNDGCVLGALDMLKAK
jgi:hypothetical protein